MASPNPSYIGGTDIAALLGLDPYKSANDVWRRIIASRAGTYEPEPPTPIMQMGIALEPYVLERYARKHVLLDSDTTYADIVDTMRSNALEISGFVHTTGSVWRASPDAIIYGPDNRRTIVDAKTVSKYARKKWPDNGAMPPLSYFYQLEFYAYIVRICTGWDIDYELTCTLAILERETGEYDEISWKPDCDRMRDITSDIIRDYDRYVVNGDPLPDDEPAVEIDSASQMQATDEIRGLVDEIRRVQNLQEPLDIELEGLKDALKTIMADARAETLMDGSTVLAKLTKTTSQRFDSKRFKSEFPETYSQYTTASDVIRLTIK